MKPFCRFLIILSLITINACESGRTKIKDGIYSLDDTGKSSLKISIQNPQGGSECVAVTECTNILVKSIYLYSLKPYENAFQLQINAIPASRDWKEKIPILIVDGKPYVELSRSSPIDLNEGESDSNATAYIKLILKNESEADLIKTKLSKRFDLKLIDQP